MNRLNLLTDKRFKNPWLKPWDSSKVKEKYIYKACLDPGLRAGDCGKPLFSEESILIERVDSKMKRCDRIDERVNRKWDELQSIATRENMLMFNGPMVRFEGVSAGDRLMFYVSDTCFKDVMGGRPAGDIYEKYGMDYLANALSIFSVVVTADNKIPIVKRRGTADFNGVWALPCGFVHPERDGYNPCKTARRTTIKDLFFDESVIKRNNFIGIYEYPDISETTACFLMEVGVDSRQIECLCDQAVSDKLYSEVIFIDNSPEMVRTFISKSKDNIHPGTKMAFQLEILWK